MKSNFLVFILSLALFSGCATAPQTPISYSSDSLPPNAKIGIVLDDVPAAQISYPGASCLLCLAVASAANSKLSAHLKENLSTEDLATIKQRIKDKLTIMGYEPIIIEPSLKTKNLPKNSSKLPNSAKRKFSWFKEKYDVDYLIAVELGYVGLQRSYSAYVPTGAPQALLLGKEYIVNTSDNTYTWYQSLNTYKSAEGEWKEPPSYPGLTNAFYQVIESVLDKVTNFGADDSKTIKNKAEENTVEEDKAVKTEATESSDTK